MNSNRTVVSLLSVFVATLVMANVVSAGTIIVPASATANTEYSPANGWGPASALIDPTDLNASNQHMAEGFASNPDWLGTDVWGTWENWVYLDLGAAYDLEELRIWNYHEDAPIEVFGRSVKDATIWVAGPGATLPAAGVPTGIGGSGFSAGGGWTQVGGNVVLTPGPSTVTPVAPMDPSDVFDLTGQTGIQYVGINVDTRWGGNSHQGWDPAYPAGTNWAPGLAQIQVTAVPEPGSLLLLMVGGMMLFGSTFRRRP